MKWLFPNQDTEDVVEWLLRSRNLSKENFLDYTTTLHDPFLIYDMQKAVKAISNAIENKKKIFIHGDFDVDGISATTIMWDFLFRKLNADVKPYIPSRFDEGYGLSRESLDAIIAQGGEFVITVDCGVKDIDLVNEYKDKLEFVITDHHTIKSFSSNENLPGSKKVGDYCISKDALAVVHPKLSGEYPFTEICGAVVSWKVCTALNEYLKAGFDMLEYIDLASLGTVCDIMPLIDENRTIVKLGLKRLKETSNVGLQELIKIAGINQDDLNEYHIGFAIGPRLNASGRLGHAMDAVRLLSTNSRESAKKLAEKLNQLNLQRQDLTKQYVELAEKKIAELDPNQKIYFIVGEDWPEGILGLIAGRLTEKYLRPVLVGSKSNGFIKGSARSIADYNIVEALRFADKYLSRHGGHAQAAGFGLDENSELDLYSALLSHANENITTSDFEKNMAIDAIANIENLDFELVELLHKFAPFGQGNLRPVLALKNIAPGYINIIGREKNHVKFVASSSQRFMEFIAFNSVERLKSDFGFNLNSSTLPNVDVAGFPEIDRWNGNKKIVFKVKDIRLAQ